MADTDFHKWQANWEKRRGETNPFTQEVLTQVPDSSGKTLLDLGCGDGRDALFFAEKGFAVTAVDFSESGIKHLQKQNPGITCIQQDIRFVSFPDASFDVIYAHLSLHYFDDATTAAIFDKIQSMLKKGGMFFVRCKSVKDPLYGKSEKVGEDMYRFDHVRHFFSLDYLRKQLNGLDVMMLQESASDYEGKHSEFVEAIAKNPEP